VIPSAHRHLHETHARIAEPTREQARATVFVPERSRTAALMQAAAPQLGLGCHFGNDIAAMEIDLAQQREGVLETINRSIRKREDRQRRDGTLTIRQEPDVAAIHKLLGGFYALHIARWETKAEVSQFTFPAQRASLERFMESYDLSEIRRLGIRAEKAGWRGWGSARASRAVFRALAEYTPRPKAFRMPVDARCAARGARHGARGARAPHARRSASHSSR
jgi:hypothetical protein